MMQDKIETLGKGSLVQHGNLNNRVYLMKLCKEDAGEIIPTIENLAHINEYTKIFCKVPAKTAPLFFANGYVNEAQIPGFYNGRETAFFVSKFLNPDRVLDKESERLLALGEMFQETPKVLPENKTFTLKKLTPDYKNQIAEFYREVFVTYPFPITNPEYILKTFNNGVIYFGVELEGKLVAMSSAEVNQKEANAEMTDFATLPQHRGENLSLFLLDKMEEDMKEMGIKTLYTIARLNSIGMNKTFIRKKYIYSGTLIKNTNISDKIESMNVYYKHI